MIGSAAALTTLCCLASGPGSAAGTAPALSSLHETFEAGAYAETLDGLDRLSAVLRGSEREAWSETLTLRGRVLVDLGRWDEARVLLDQALRMLAGTPHVGALLDNLLARGHLMRARGRLEEADRVFQEASSWAEALPDEKRSRRIQLARARVGLRTGRLDLARAAARAARAGCRDDRCRAEADVLAGEVSLARGEPDVAERLLLSAAAGFAASGLRRGESESLAALVDVYRALEDPDRAEVVSTRAIALAESLGNRPIEAALRGARGELLLASGRLEEAERDLLSAASLYEAMKAVPGAAGSRLALGRLSMSAGRRGGAGAGDARVHLLAAASAFEAMGDLAGLASVHEALADAAAIRGDREDEEVWLRRVTAGGGGDWRGRARLGALLLLRGEAREARTLLEDAASRAEEVDALGAPRGDRERLRTARLGAYDALLDAWLAGGREPEEVRGALLAAERSGETAFLDLVERARLRRADSDLAAILDRLDAVDRRLAGLPAGETLRGPRLRLERALLEAEARRLAPPPARTSAQRIGEAVAAVARDLEDGVAVLRYHLGPDRSRLFLLTSDGLSVHDLPAGAEIEPLAVAFHRSLRRPARTEDEVRRRLDLSARLHAILLGPVLEGAVLDGAVSGGPGRLRGRTRLVVVPDGALGLVPFDALADTGGEPLVLRHTVSYAPSVARVAELRAASSRPAAGDVRFPLAAFADPVYEGPAPIALPRLTGSRREVEQAVGWLGAGREPGTLFLREAATEEALKLLALDRYRIVHLATHGYAGGDGGVEGPGAGLPALFLGAGGGEDGVLGIDEVLDLDLDADLVVLSACDSGREPDPRGEGAGGLTGAFLEAGARSVLATLWAVEDDHAARLMDVFYRRLAEGAPSPAALRDARLALLASGTGRESTPRGIGGIVGPEAEPAARPPVRRRTVRARDPFFWASYVLVGDAGDILK